MALRLKVTYLDGREETVLVSARAQVETERHYAGTSDAKAVEQSYYLSWMSLHKAGKEPDDFDAFLDKVAQAEPVEEGGVLGPTTGAASPTASSD